MNQNRIRKIIAVLSAVFLVIASGGCGKAADETSEAAGDEIVFQIKLDIKEDIGLLVVNYESDSISGSGGTSNAINRC